MITVLAWMFRALGSPQAGCHELFRVHFESWDFRVGEQSERARKGLARKLLDHPQASHGLRSSCYRADENPLEACAVHIS